MLRSTRVFVVLTLLTVGAPGLASATLIGPGTFTYVDQNLGGTIPNGLDAVTYTLTLSGASCPPVCNVSVTITNTATSTLSPAVYLGSLDLHLDGGTKPAISGLTTVINGVPSPLWLNAPDTTATVAGKTVAPDGFTGIYNSNPTASAGQVLLTGKPGSSTTIAFTASGVGEDFPIPLHNIYYEISGGGAAFDTILSVDTAFQPVPLTSPVPEPSTLLLIGSGLAGLGMLVRKAWRPVKRA